MKKKYKVIVTNETFVTVDVDENTTDNELLDKVEDELSKGYVINETYIEVEGEVEDNE